MSLKLHHIGILVRDISKSSTEYAERFGYKIESGVIQDTAQTAFVQFLRLPGEKSYVELISPDRPDGKLSRSLEKGGGINHLCYATDAIEKKCDEMRSCGMLILQKPIPAAAFPDRRIAWLIGLDGVPVELVEANDDNWFCLA